jgi:mannose-6-phosphate isomerase
VHVKLNAASTKSYKIANKYFSVEVYDVKGAIEENADRSRFHIYVFVDGAADINYKGGKIEAARGDSILIPAALGKYTIEGRFKALKTYVPNIERDIIKPLLDAGYLKDEILDRIAGLK